MNYELAKQLKDAGFPKISFVACDGSELQFGIDGQKYIENLPTLSELIEACGKSFRGLAKTTDEVHKYMACCWYGEIGDYTNIGAYSGSTEEEAVANLWLALNKK